MSLEDKWDAIDLKTAIDYQIDQITGEKGNHTSEFEKKRAERESGKLSDLMSDFCDALLEQNAKIVKTARKAFVVDNEKH